MEQQGNWDRYLPLAKFAYNNSYHARISMAPYKALYGQKGQSLLCWYEPGERSLLGLNLVKQTIEQIKRIWSKILTAQSHTYDTKPLEFQEGDH